MKNIIINNRALPPLLFIASILAAAGPVALAGYFSSEYGFFSVPIASWVAFALSGVILALGGLASYFWHQFQEKRRELSNREEELREKEYALTELMKQPITDRIPAVLGHKTLGSAEFLVLVQLFFLRSPSNIEYIRLTSLPGGYSDSTTVLAKLQTLNDTLLPLSFVLKLGKKETMANERAKFDRFVHARLTKIPPSHTTRYAERGDFAGIAYQFAGLGGEIRNFYQFYQGGAILEAAELIEKIFSPLDEAWYQCGQKTSVDLYNEYRLLSKKRADIIRHALKIVDKNDPYYNYLKAETQRSDSTSQPNFAQDLEIPWYDPAAFLCAWSTHSLSLPVHRSIVHGDLNARNVLVETKKGGAKDIWFIDFSHVGNGLSQTRTEEARQEGSLIDENTGHTLRDFCRLEADIKFVLTRLYDENDLNLAISIEKELMNCGMAVDDAQVKLPHAEALLDERFRKAWQVIREIRRRAAKYLVNPKDLRPYYLGLLHATLPAVYYHPEQFESELCERQQKRYAFISAGMLCSRLLKK